jgi:predicted dehydrogenase
MNKRYTTAVIGCGRAGFSYDIDPKRVEIFSHIGAYRSCQKVSKICAVDPDINQLNMVRERYPEIECFENIDEMFEKNKIDILSICSPEEDRLKIVEKSIKNNVSAIFCEKPISNNLIEAKTIVRACSENNVKLAVNHFRRWDKFHINFANLVRKGEIGRIQNIVVKYNKGILNTGSHIFDFIRMISGEIKSVSCIGNPTPDQKDPSLNVSGKTCNGENFFLIGSDHNNFRIFEVEVLGEKGRISTDNGYEFTFETVNPSKHNSEFHVLEKVNYDMIDILGKGRVGHYESAVSNIIDSLEKNKKILCDGDSALSSLLAAHSCLISHATGHKIELSELQLV